MDPEQLHRQARDLYFEHLEEIGDHLSSKTSHHLAAVLRHDCDDPEVTGGRPKDRFLWVKGRKVGNIFTT